MHPCLRPAGQGSVTWQGLLTSQPPITSCATEPSLETSLLQPPPQKSYPPPPLKTRKPDWATRPSPRATSPKVEFHSWLLEVTIQVTAFPSPVPTAHHERKRSQRCQWRLAGPDRASPWLITSEMPSEVTVGGFSSRPGHHCLAGDFGLFSWTATADSSPLHVLPRGRPQAEAPGLDWQEGRQGRDPGAGIPKRNLWVHPRSPRGSQDSRISSIQHPQPLHRANPGDWVSQATVPRGPGQQAGAGASTSPPGRHPPRPLPA